ncbi:NUDIX domain-containing protein, partial [Salmonella enterica]|nr:NUDIX domain-containing protein [Salmonella enterica]
ALQGAFKEIFDDHLRRKYDPTFVTSDACIIQSGHVLVIRRGALPGKGLIALPGGFVKSKQTLLMAAIIEAIEETGLKLADGKRWKEIT